mmetsp:Transcript_45215/g.102096  ORF Transcript_45215/g.102096 Transcript_45215/m.102096 type:complete len:633 (-) Transcript_45215:141-2039(-)
MMGRERCGVKPRSKEVVIKRRGVYGFFFEMVTGVLAKFFDLLDISIKVAARINPVRRRSPCEGRNSRPPSVVVIGASIAGLAVQRELGRAGFQVTLVDCKDYFEYTPGILRCFVEPEHFRKALARPLRSSAKSSHEIISGAVLEAGPGSIVLRSPKCSASGPQPRGSHGAAYRAQGQLLGKSEGGLSRSQGGSERIIIEGFDFLVVACGAGYPDTTIKTPCPGQKAAEGQLGDVVADGAPGLRAKGGGEPGEPAEPAESAETPPPRDPWTLEGRAEAWLKAAAALREARHVLIVGGGAVGVELAAEIAAAFRLGRHHLAATAPPPPAYQVTLVSRSPGLLAGLPPAAGRAALSWLRERGVEVVLGSSVASVAPTHGSAQGGGVEACRVELASGDAWDGVDRVFWCGGLQASSSGLLRRHFSGSLDDRGFLVVNDHLQVDGHPHVFACGDVMSHPESNEPKLGYTAELNAHVVVENIKRLAKAWGLENVEPLRPADPSGGLAREAREGFDGACGELVCYPQGAHGLLRSPQVCCVSLGPHHGVLCFNSLVLGGRLPALVKWVIETTKVAAMEERPAGELFWKFGDWAAAALSTRIFPVPAHKHGETAVPARSFQGALERAPQEPQGGASKKSA